MRIISGKAGGIRLKSLKNSNARPTLDRVKEALFSILAPYLREAKVLDLFAGFGGLGLEAVSRGAKEVTLVERNRKNADIIRKNIDLCNFNNEVELIQGDVFKFLDKSNSNFDIIIMDPPYNKKYGEKLLKIISNNNLIKDKGLVVIEHGKNETINDVNDLIKFKEKKYGDTFLTILVKREEN